MIGVYGLSKNRYSVATRAQKVAKSFQKVAAVRRFGTEGSVACPAVALAEADSNPLAPTNSPKKHRRIQSFRPLGFTRVVSSIDGKYSSVWDPLGNRRTEIGPSRV